MAAPKPMLTEFDIHHRLESCVHGLRTILRMFTYDNDADFCQWRKSSQFDWPFHFIFWKWAYTWWPITYGSPENSVDPLTRNLANSAKVNLSCSLETLLASGWNFRQILTMYRSFPYLYSLNMPRSKGPRSDLSPLLLVRLLLFIWMNPLKSSLTTKSVSKSSGSWQTRDFHCLASHLKSVL